MNFFPQSRFWVWWLSLFFLVGLGVVNASTGFYSHDQMEYILGGQALLQGQVLYSDFFSQLAPLPYYIAAAFRSVVPLTWLPWVFNLLLVGWAVSMWRLLARSYGHPIGWSTAAFILLSLPYVGGQTFLDETFVFVGAVSAVALTLVAFPKGENTINHFQLYFASTLASACALASLAYVPFAFFLLGFIAVVLWTHSPQDARMRSLMFALITAGALPVLFVVTLIITHSFHSFIFNVYTFNKIYYAPYVIFPHTILSWFISGFQNTLRVLWESIQGFSFGSLLILALYTPLACAVALAKRMKQKYVAILFAMTTIFLSARFFHAQDFTVTDFVAHEHVSALVGCCILALAYCAHALQQLRARKIAYALGLGLASAILLGTFFHYTFRAVVSEPQYDLVRSTTPLACMVNALTSPSGTTWTGPYMMYDALLLKPPRAARFPYFFPLHADCATCKAELIVNLQELEPDVLIINRPFRMFNQSLDRYLPELTALLDNQYWQLGEPAARFLYFRHSLSKAVVELQWNTCKSSDT